MSIEECISRPALLEQLAEECTELAQASLKYARKLRGENPTPVTLADARIELIEEMADVLLCVDVVSEACGVPETGIDLQKMRKKQRWEARLERFNREKGE